VTMASIVEKEARVPEERPVIAAVYYNRLRRGMLLQADPTVQYALGHHVGRVLYKDLATASEYNTYTHKGLPPGPVASPGVASLAAAANPASVPYLYFVASPDGHHEFRMTLEQHTSAIRQVRAAAPVKKKPAPRMLAMASTGASTRSAATPSSRTSARSSAKTPAKTASKTASRSTSKTVKPAAKKSTAHTTTTKKRSSTRTTPSTSR
jgi:hypothetical protein